MTGSLTRARATGGRNLFRASHAVKSSRAPAENRRSPGWRRHVEGWQAGLVTVGMVLLAAVLSVPRDVPPDVLPVPRVDPAAHRHAALDDRRRTAQALREPLPFAVRSVGEHLRRHGQAQADGDAGRAALAAAQLRRSVQDVRAQLGDEPLLQLRAVQTHVFLEALAHWEATGGQGTDLRQLGATLLQDACRAGWVTAPRRLALSGPERRILFRMRWNELAGLADEPPFAPTLNDWRTYYRFLLQHPATTSEHPSAAARALVALQVVRALERRDDTYPALLARGVLQYRAGSFAAAAESFRMHLAAHPDGAWRLRAQNHLSAALARASNREAL